MLERRGADFLKNEHKAPSTECVGHIQLTHSTGVRTTNTYPLNITQYGHLISTVSQWFGENYFTLCA